MTYAPASYRNARQFLIDELDMHPGADTHPDDLDPAEVGIVGGPSHVAKGTSYHLGRDQLRMDRDPYSARLLRDRAGLTDGAAALDIGQFRKVLPNGAVVTHRTLGTWLVTQCQAGAPDAAWIREVIWSPDGTTVLRYDHARGQKSAPRPGEADDSHLTHDHLSGYRDAETTNKTAIFRRYLAEMGDDMSAADVINYVVSIKGDLQSSPDDVDTQAPVGKILADTWRFGLDIRSLVIGFEAKDAARDQAAATAAAELTGIVRDMLTLIRLNPADPTLAPIIERLDALPEVIRVAAAAGGQAGADRVLTTLAAAERAAADQLATPVGTLTPPGS